MHLVILLDNVRVFGYNYTIIGKGCDMEEQEKSFNKLNKNLNHDVSNLWDKSFGDLPIVTQRLVKTYGTMSSKKAYRHSLQRKTELHVFEGERYFEKGSPQQIQAQAITEKIVNKLKNGNNQASKVLSDFLKDKKVKVGVYKSTAPDAAYNDYNPLTKEIYITLCAGLFHPNQKFPDIISEDCLARIIGHELGHAVERENRSCKSHPNYVGYSSNSWEVESFCDAFGVALCAGAGYNFTAYMNAYKVIEEQELANHKEENPHPPVIQRRKLMELMLKAYNAENPPNSPQSFPKEIQMLEWDARKLDSIKEKNQDTSNIER